MSVEAILSRFQEVRRRGNGWIARCPAHEDKNPSLSIDVHDVKILLHCFAGCSKESVLTSAGIEPRELFLDGRHNSRIVATYEYSDENDQVLFQVVRYEPKSFRQRRSDGKGGWTWNLGDIRRVVYRLSEVIAADSVIVVEGEKDVEALREALRGLKLLGPWAATCNAGGAGKWRPEFSEKLRGKEIYIICDDDTTGLAHGRSVAADALGVARNVRIVEALSIEASKNLPKDAAEFFEQGGNWQQLQALFEKAPIVTQDVVSAWDNVKKRRVKESTVQQDTKLKCSSKDSKQLVIDHLELSDGKQIEIIEDAGKVHFLAFTPGNTSFEVMDQIENGGHTYTPRSGSFVAIRGVLLPNRPDFSEGEDPDLFDDLCEFVCRYWIGPANWIRVVVLYVLLTWIAHTVDEIAYLRIVGDLGSAKSRFCDILQALCYRAVRAAGNITAGVLPRILTSYPGATLVVDEADLRGESADEVRQILRCGSSRKTPVIKCVPSSDKGAWEPAAFSVFGPKVIAVRTASKDDAFETRCITESITQAPALGHVPVTLPTKFEQEAVSLRARLMAFRVLNFNCGFEFRQAIGEAEKELLAARLDFRTTQLGAPLFAMATMLAHGTARESCLRVLQHHDTNVRLERGQGVDGLLVRFVQNLRLQGITRIELGVFRESLKTYAEEEEDWDSGFLPKKQALSRRLNLHAHALGIHVEERRSGHADRTIRILPFRAKERLEDSARHASAPITPTGSSHGAEEDEVKEGALHDADTP